MRGFYKKDLVKTAVTPTTSPMLTQALEPTATPEPTVTPKPTVTQKPAVTPEPTATPKPKKKKRKANQFMLVTSPAKLESYRRQQKHRKHISQ